MGGTSQLMSELYVLDVGHGNSSLLWSSGQATVLDAAPGNVLLEMLEQSGITEIENVFVSHADADHIGGILNLLSQFTVRHLFINTDPRDTAVWRDLRDTVNASVQSYGLQRHSLDTSMNRKVSVGDVTVEILAPSAGLALSGVGGHDQNGNQITANSMSAVIGLEHDGHRVMLLAADMDEASLERILENRQNLTSQALVFPHHGGRTATDSGLFAEKLCNLVKPRLTLFSIGRGKYGTPRPEVIAGVRKAVPRTHILCTQLSQHCAEIVPLVTHHLNELPSAGRETGNCCGGSIRLELRGAETSYSPFDIHQTFVREHVHRSLCNRSQSGA
jgi:beta-lactamase superfamily II metal-dependent hydrolase